MATVYLRHKLRTRSAQEDADGIFDRSFTGTDAMEHRRSQERYQKAIPDNGQRRTVLCQGCEAHSESTNRLLNEQGADGDPQKQTPAIERCQYAVPSRTVRAADGDCAATTASNTIIIQG